MGSMLITGEMLSALHYSASGFVTVPKERERVEVSGDGAYLHGPDLDEDLPVAGLLAGNRSGESPESLETWLRMREAVGTQVR